MSLPLFPTASLPGLAFPVKRSPKWQTIKQDALSGKRTRFALQSYPLWAYELTFSSGQGGFLRSSVTYPELQTFAGFYNSLQGAQGLFQFNDPNDGAVTAQLFGEGTGLTATTFQLVRSYGGFVEPVFLPNTASGFHIFDNGSDVTANATVSPYGVVSFASIAPASGDALTWTGTFGWPCRFDDDTAEFSTFMQNLAELNSLKFTTEKLP